MSGRIRTIKPELLDDKVTAGLSDIAFRLFVASLILADDYGNLRWEPEWLKAQVFWLRRTTLDEVADALDELESKLVHAYIISDQRYGAIRGWAKHQQVDKPGKPIIPGPPEEVATPSRDSRDSLETDHRSLTPTPGGEVERDPPVPLREHIRALRIQAGISSRELDRRAGLSEGHVNHIENGDITRLRVDTIQRLAVALDVTTSSLVDLIPLELKARVA